MYTLIDKITVIVGLVIIDAIASFLFDTPSLFTCKTSLPLPLMIVGGLAFVTGFILWSCWFEKQPNQIYEDMQRNLSPEDVRLMTPRPLVASVADFLTRWGLISFALGIIWFLVCLFL